ncbi:MAG TPA: MazG family protein [Acidimicrobiia bacterium]
MILITGLGPGDIARIPGPVLDLLLDPETHVIIRTRNHPAAEQIAALREVEFCDDLYLSGETFEEVYSAIADRVVEAGASGSVIYAVPGGPWLGEFAVREILERGSDVQVLQGETFVDAILSATGYDPFQRGLQIINGHDLPSPLIIDKPTIVGHLDRPEILADVSAALSRVLPEGSKITVFSGLGGDDECVVESEIDDVDSALAGFRTSLWIDAESGGIVGAIRTMGRLRSECPWDREQSHASLAKNLIEEAYELIDTFDEVEADPDDLVAYARVEEELGDVLLQVLFHAAIAGEAGAFDINDAAEVLRQKLVRRHPHVFSDVEVADADEVKANWDEIKRLEKGVSSGSAMDGIPSGMPAIYRASKVQNRANKAGIPTASTEAVVARIKESLLGIDGDSGQKGDVIGGAMFDLVDLARRSGLDAEHLLRTAVDRFEVDFRHEEHER